MKTIKITFILILLSLKLFAQIDFPKDIIAKNKIIKASKYLVVPKNNPNYKKMLGLMLESDTFFDKKGNVISSVNVNGAVTSHSDSKDIKRYYFYKDDRIIKMSKVDFDSISVEYVYFDKKNIIFQIKTNNKKERIGFELIYLDANNRKELKKVEIDFHNTTKINDAAYLYKSNITYFKNIRKSKVLRKLCSISNEQLNIFKNSIEIENIQNELNKIENNTVLDAVNFETVFIYNKKNQLIKEISENQTIEYKYNKLGLLLKCNVKNIKYNFISKFIYSKN